MQPFPAEESESSKPEPTETCRDDRSYHHVIIASCDTRDGLPDNFNVVEAMVSGFLYQKRAPSFIVLLPSHDDSMVYKTIFPLLQEEMAKKGTLVLSCPMDSGGDLVAFEKALKMLDEQFEKNMTVPFNTAWVTYLNFPGRLHADFCRVVFKSAMLSRWECSETSQVLMFNEKLEETADFGQIHDAVVTGRCAKLFFDSKISRIMKKQENIYWFGIYVMFCRSPMCLDDQVGVAHHVRWPEKEPMIYLGLGEKINFEGKRGCIKKITDIDTLVPKYHVYLNGEDQEKQVILHREEFNLIPRSMRGVYDDKHLERARLFRKRSGEKLWVIPEAVCLNLLGNVETATEAAMALGALIDQQEALTGAMKAHLDVHLRGVPRTDLEKTIVQSLVDIYDEERVCKDLGYPDGYDLKTAFEKAERTEQEVMLLVNRAPVVGGINMCRMLGIEPLPWKDAVDDGKELPVLYGRLAGGKEGIDFKPVTVGEIVQEIIKNVNLPESYRQSITKYCTIYCLSKGVSIIKG